MKNEDKLILGEIRGFDAAQSVWRIMHNCLGINTIMVGVRHSDTSFTYQVIAHGKFNKAKTAETKAFFEGIRQAFIAVDYSR